jgi:hypothetical protein
MNKYFPMVIILALVFASCTSSQFATYRPAGSTEANWQINVLHKSGFTENFKVVINDSTVIDDDANFFSGNAEAKGSYRDKEIKLMVTYSSGFLGIGKKFTAMVFISNELAGKFEF